MISYGVTCPHCRAAIKVEISVKQLRVLVSKVGKGNGRVKPGITEEIPAAQDQAAAAPDLAAEHSTFYPPDPPSHPCPSCGEPGIYIDGVAKKGGRPYKAWKCNNPRCRDDGELVPGTFRWLPQPVSV